MSSSDKNPSVGETNMAHASKDQMSGSFDRDQPWKKFVNVSECVPVAFVGDNKNIRMKEGRVDGKDIGG